MTLETLPAVLEPMVEKVADQCGVWETDARDVILAFLNAALEAGVAGHETVWLDGDDNLYVKADCIKNHVRPPNSTVS